MWLAELTECGLLRGSFIPPPQIAAIRELTRHRKKLIEQRASELRRLGKVLEDSGIRIDSVASTLTTVSAREMIEALIIGERDPAVPADLARGVMRRKIPDLRMACAGRFGDLYALMCTLHLEHTFIADDLLDRLPTPTRIGATRIGGVDLNKRRIRHALSAVLALSAGSAASPSPGSPPRSTA